MRESRKEEDKRNIEVTKLSEKVKRETKRKSREKI